MEDFSHLWERHITILRDDFSADNSVRALTSGSPSLQDGDGGEDYKSRPSGQHVWDDKIDSVVDALDELSLQSPTGKTNTTTTQSPRTPWFPDGDAYTETAPLRSHKIQALPVLPWPTDPPTPSPSIWPPQQDQKEGQQQMLYQHHTTRHLPLSPSTLSSRTAVPGSTTTPATTLHSPLPFTQSPPPSSVSVLCLSWAPPQARPGPDGQLFSPSLPTDVEAVRSCFKKRGWKVQCRLIPSDYSTSAVETVIDRFLAQSQNQTVQSQNRSRARDENEVPGGELLIVYYHGFGATEDDGRLKFNSDEGNYFYWDDVRDPIMQHPGDVLLIFDCTAPLPCPPDDSNNQHRPDTGNESEAPQEMRLSMGPGMLSRKGTKQVLGVCVPSSLTSGGPRSRSKPSYGSSNLPTEEQRPEMAERPRARPRSLLLPGFDVDDLKPSDPIGTQSPQELSQQESKPSNSTWKLDDTMTKSLCKILHEDRNRVKAELGIKEILSVQRLCSLVREDIRQTSSLSSTIGSDQREAAREIERGLAGRVFVTQLGGGQIQDIYLPCLGA
ncbi:hypothetical protein B0T21DRAFT_76380 [Apiosordaria backusii]|uniref:Uncharacterized protein n=1 Tax=Apiosordaria backusii TaxID=314023 RepID=A0AA40AAK9_9PEZI|nr:hypothetical protein B0T21DRAFT_76380 [Apiosordaria backusii]